MPLLTDEEATAIATAKFYKLVTEEQLQALSYLEKNVLEFVHREESFVDVEELFSAYDTLYFDGFMKGIVDVIWSSKMTLCAGTCELKPRNHKQTSRSTWPEGVMVRIKLSEPILKFRPSIDLLNTLLHEMIHAYLFIAGGKHVRGEDPSGHGAGFLSFAKAINEHSNGFYDITIYHNFHDEVDHYRTHIWKCTGPCTTKPPYFGIVKRAMNRPPGPSDSWWQKHQTECGGNYIKVSEPPPKDRGNVQQKNRLDTWVLAGLSGSEGEDTSSAADLPGSAAEDSSSKGKKRKRLKDKIIDSSGNKYCEAAKRIRNTSETGYVGEVNDLIQCQSCDHKAWQNELSEHMDAEHFGF